MTAHSTVEAAADARRAITNLIAQASDDPSSSYRVLVQLFKSDNSVVGVLASALDDLAAGLASVQQTQASRVLSTVADELRGFTDNHHHVVRALQMLTPHPIGLARPAMTTSGRRRGDRVD